MSDAKGAHASHPVYISVHGVRAHAKLTKSIAQSHGFFNSFCGFVIGFLDRILLIFLRICKLLEKFLLLAVHALWDFDCHFDIEVAFARSAQILYAAILDFEFRAALRSLRDFELFNTV